jgi:hypothetical protein
LALKRFHHLPQTIAFERFLHDQSLHEGIEQGSAGLKQGYGLIQGLTGQQAHLLINAIARHHRVGGLGAQPVATQEHLGSITVEGHWAEL